MKKGEKQEARLQIPVVTLLGSKYNITIHSKNDSDQTLMITKCKNLTFNLT